MIETDWVRVGAALAILAVAFGLREIHYVLARRRMEQELQKKLPEITVEEVFDRLLRLREMAEHSDPRPIRRGTPAKIQPYLGWAELADSNWQDYYRLRRAAMACRFL